MRQLAEEQPLLPLPRLSFRDVHGAFESKAAPRIGDQLDVGLDGKLSAVLRVMADLAAPAAGPGQLHFQCRERRSRDDGAQQNFLALPERLVPTVAVEL